MAIRLLPLALVATGAVAVASDDNLAVPLDSAFSGGLCTGGACTGAAAGGSGSSLAALRGATGCNGKADAGGAEATLELLECMFEHWYPSRTPDASVLGRAGTYGELTPRGVAEVFRVVAALGVPLGSEDAFFDLGSGLGKVVLQAVMTTDTGSATGIELDPDRHELAVQGLGKMRQATASAFGSPSGTALADRASFLEGDIRDTSWWSNASVIYASSLCFPPFLMLELSWLLPQTLRPGATVFSLTPIPGCHRGLLYLGTTSAAMTWNDAFQVHVYVVPPVASGGVPRPWLAIDDARAVKDAETEALAAEEALAAASLTGPIGSLAASAVKRWGGEGLACSWRRAFAAVAAVAASGTKKSVARGFGAASGAAAPVGVLLRGVAGEASESALKAEVKAAALHPVRGREESAASCLHLELEALVDAEQNSSGPLQAHFFDSSRLGMPADEQARLSDASRRTGAVALALHAAAQATLPYPRAVAMLVAQRAELDAQDAAGRTALGYCAQKGHVTLLEELLKARADASGADATSKSTPLHHAVAFYKIPVVEALLHHRADVNAKDDQGSTPLHKLRTAAGHQVEDQADLAQLLIEGEANVDAQDNSGKTLAHFAAMQNIDGLLQVLLEARADPGPKDGLGNTPLHACVAKSGVAVASLLLEHRAMVDAPGAGGSTPLARAVTLGHTSLTRLLVSHGASPTAVDRSGWTPLRHAQSGGKAEMLALLGGETREQEL